MAGLSLEKVRPKGRPRTRLRDFISRLAWEYLKVEHIVGEKDAWTTLISLLDCFNQKHFFSHSSAFCVYPAFYTNGFCIISKIKRKASIAFS